MNPWPPSEPIHRLKPGTVLMHTRQYNKLCDAGMIRVRSSTGREPELYWNGVPVIRDDNIPPGGWFIVPGGGGGSEIVTEHIVVKSSQDDDDES